MPNKTNNFVFRRLLQSDIPDCVDISCQNFDEFRSHPERIEQWFRNRLVNNPWQNALPAIGVGALYNDALVGFRAVFAQPWWLNKKSTIIGFCGNTSIDQNFRGKGLASQLIDHSRKFTAITGTTTAGSITQKAHKKLGSVPIGGTSNDFFRLRVSYQDSCRKRIGDPFGGWLGLLFDINLKLRDYKIGPTKDFSLEEVFVCNSEFDRFWENSKHGYISCLERSSTYLNWRLFDFPTCPLRLFSLKDKTTKLRAYAIWHKHNFADSVSVAVLRDIFYPIEDELALRNLLYRLLEYWRNTGITWVSLEVSSPQLTSFFQSLKYESLPSHGNRYQIYSEPTLEHRILDNWFRSGIDGDYFDYSLKE